MGSRRWIREVDTSGQSIKSDRYLGIPDGKRIPKTFLRRVVNAKIGNTVKNPTETGNRRVKVTRKLKQKAVFAWNVTYPNEDP